ncbi:MAG: hypothetical protein AAFV95_00420 [Bacteroidota bacterium]
MENVTVDQAIQKSYDMAGWSSYAIVTIGFVSTMFIAVILERIGLASIVFLTSLSLMWVWWRYHITQWRIWAFDNCRNVHELLKRSTQLGLIYPEKSFFHKIDVQTKSQQRKLATLEDKFLVADEETVIEDDGSVPEETKIYRSKLNLAYHWIAGIACLAYGTYAFVAEDYLIAPLMLFLFSLGFLYDAIQKTFFQKLHITLNSQGVQILSRPLVEWENIQSVEVKYARQKPYLFVTHWEGEQRVKRQIHTEITSLQLNSEKIRWLAKLYHQRHKN